MSHAVRFYQTGGPEVLVWEPAEVSKPGPGKARPKYRGRRRLCRHLHPPRPITRRRAGAQLTSPSYLGCLERRTNRKNAPAEVASSSIVSVRLAASLGYAGRVTAMLRDSMYNKHAVPISTS